MFNLLKTCAILTAFALAGLNAGCGQTGALYLPDQPRPAKPKPDAEDSQQSTSHKPRIYLS